MNNSIKVNIELPATFMMSCNVNAYMRYTLKIDTILICFDTYALVFKFTVFILLFLLVVTLISKAQKAQNIIFEKTNIHSVAKYQISKKLKGDPLEEFFLKVSQCRKTEGGL